MPQWFWQGLVTLLSIATTLHDGALGYTPASLAGESAGASLAQRLDAMQTWPDLMGVFGKDSRFRDEYWAKKPLLARSNAVRSCFSVQDVRAAAEQEELLAGQNSFLVRNPESFEVAPGMRRGTKITTELLETGLLNGTLFMNDAAAAWPQLFEIARAGTRELGFPVNMNVYITHRALERSTPLHTDRQDVIIMQCEGRKHWHVHNPVVNLPAQHQERGKAGDIISVDEAGPLLLNVTLGVGDLLYVPRGFVHATTAPPLLDDGHKVDDFSTSLTVGIQTESMGFTYEKLLLCGLFLYGEGPSLPELQALSTAHEFLRRPLPLQDSFLRPTSGNFLEGAADELLGSWRLLFPGQLAPPREKMLHAGRIITEGHRHTLSEYQEKMLDTAVPKKLRQEVWSRRYDATFYKMLGQCGFLTRSYEKKFWLPKFTNRQLCYGNAPKA